MSSPYPAGYCEPGSLARLKASDWLAMAKADQARADASLRRARQALAALYSHGVSCSVCHSHVPTLPAFPQIEEPQVN